MGNIVLFAGQNYQISDIVHKGSNFIVFQSVTDFTKVWPNIRDFIKL